MDNLELFQAVAGIATGLLAISEALSLIPGIKANGVFQAIVAVIKIIAGRGGKAAAIFFLIIGVAGCATLNATTQFVVDSAAQDVGYLGYTLVPEARIPLAAMCDLTGDDAVALQAQVTEQMGKVWTASNTTAGAAVCLKVNRIITAMKETAEEKLADVEFLAFLKNLVDQVCAGVNQARAT